MRVPPDKSWWPDMTPPARGERSGPAPLSFAAIGHKTRGAKGVELPFRVRLVRNEDQLYQAIQVRYEAYARHHPAVVADRVGVEEEDDKKADAIVLLAESKIDSAPMGSMRVHVNVSEPLVFEKEFSLPERYRHKTLAHITRLAVTGGDAGRLVKLALFKTLHRYCHALQIDWMLVAGVPPLHRQYLKLGFTDVFDDGLLRPSITTASLPARLLSFEVPSAERRWSDAGHPLYNFMVRDFHPDIEIFNSVRSMWSQPRARRFNAPQDLETLQIPVV